MWKEAISTYCDMHCIKETQFHKLKSPECTHKCFPRAFKACIVTMCCGLLIAVSGSRVIPYNSCVIDTKLNVL